MANYIPVYIKSSHLKCLIVGGGKIAARKARTLLRQGLKPTFISPEISGEVKEIVEKYSLIFIKKAFEPSDLTHFNFVIAATSDKITNQFIKKHISENIFFNDVSEGHSGNFLLPAVLERGDLKIAVSSNGKAPYLAKEICAFIDTLLPKFQDNDLTEIFEKRKQIVQETENDETSKRQRLETELVPLVKELFKNELI